MKKQSVPSTESGPSTGSGSSTGPARKRECQIAITFDEPGSVKEMGCHMGHVTSGQIYAAAKYLELYAQEIYVVERNRQQAAKPKFVVPQGALKPKA